MPSFLNARTPERLNAFPSAFGILSAGHTVAPPRLTLRSERGQTHAAEDTPAIPHLGFASILASDPRGHSFRERVFSGACGAQERPDHRAQQSEWKPHCLGVALANGGCG